MTPTITPKRIVQAKQCGAHIEVKTFSHMNKKCHIQKLDKEQYVVKKTGEVKEIVHHTKRIDDTISLYRTIALGRDVIRCNTPFSSNVLFLTLTYKENMTDTNKLRYDFGNFIKRIPTEFKPYKWICAVEPQQRGAWHCHVLFIYEHTAPFLPNEVVSSAWKQGFTTTKKIDNVDDVGAYLCAYLTDIEVEDTLGYHTSEMVEKNVNGFSKRFIKGGRLSFYPAGMRIFRYSTNCTKPVKTQLLPKTYDEWKLYHTPYYTHTKELKIGDYENTIVTECYNFNRGTQKHTKETKICIE